MCNHCTCDVGLCQLPLSALGDVMLVWRKRSINKTASVLQHCIPLNGA